MNISDTFMFYIELVTTLYDALCCDKANSCQSDDGTLMGKKCYLI